MRSNETSRVTDPRELSEAGHEGRYEHSGRPSDVPRMNEPRAQRPQVVGVPLEPVKTGPHWVPPARQTMGAQPILGAPQPLLGPGQPVPINRGSGRIPDGGGNGSMKQRSVFEGPRGPGAPIHELRLVGLAPNLQQLQVSQAAHAGVPQGPPPPEPRRVIGQAAPAETEVGKVQIERIIERQLPPQGMTKKEALQLADALTIAIGVSEIAIASGEVCFGVDDATIADAKATRDYLANFAYTAAAADRTNPSRLPKERLDTVERILECQMAHERLQAQKSGNILAFVIGGAIIAGVTYLVVKTL